MLRGLDASSVQGKLPFELLKASGYRFIVIKAQQGNDGLDPQFAANVKGAFSAGIEPFAYCFAYPLPHLDPKEQARLFVERTQALLPGRPLFLDFEWPSPEQWVKWGCTAPQISQWLKELCEEVVRLTGLKPILYTYPYWWSSLSLGADVSWAADYALWLAAYVKSEPAKGANPKVPKPWSTWLFWQWDGNGGMRLPNGIDADFCVFNGGEAELAALIRCEEAPPTQPSPGTSIAVDLNTIRGLQARLLALGFDPGPIDGVRGPQTDRAVKAFQTSRGLVADGIVGARTRAALLA